MARRRTRAGSPADAAAAALADRLQPDFAPEAVREIADVETLRAISDPLRLRILETMVGGDDRRAWSVKDLAAALQVAQTRLYHHVDLLVAHGLVRPVERRVVSGIIETRYRVAARSFQLDRRLFAGSPGTSLEVVHDTLVSIFDTSRDEIERALRSGAVDVSGAAPPERRVLVSRGVARLSPARVEELRRRLTELIGELEADDGDGADAFGLLLAFYPLPDGPTRSADG